jgi:hypothetical protein
MVLSRPGLPGRSCGKMVLSRPGLPGRRGGVTAGSPLLQAAAVVNCHFQGQEFLCRSCRQFQGQGCLLTRNVREQCLCCPTLGSFVPGTNRECQCQGLLCPSHCCGSGSIFISMRIQIRTRIQECKPMPPWHCESMRIRIQVRLEATKS